MQQKLKMVVTGNDQKEKQKFDIVLSTLLFLYCVALPFEEALASSFGSVLRFLGVLIIGYSVCIYCRYRIRIYTLRFLIPFALWMLLALISVLWSEDISWWIYFVQIYLFQFIFVVFVIAYNQRVNIKFLENGLIIGSILASSILIFFPQVSQLTRDGRRTVVVFGQNLDPNIVACIIMLGLFACLRRIFEYKTKGILSKVLIIYLVIGMLFTGSRGALISFVVGLAVLVFLEMRDRGSRARVLLLIIIVAITAIVAIYYIPEELLMSRFSSENLLGINEYTDGAHNRYTIWFHSLKLFVDSPVIGYGCGNFFSAIEKVYRECASHNMYVLVAVEEGLIGLCTFGIGFLCIFRGLYKRRLYTMFAMFTSICVMAMTLDTITYKYFWVSLMLVLIAMNSSEHQKERDKKLG